MLHINRIARRLTPLLAVCALAILAGCSPYRPAHFDESTRTFNNYEDNYSVILPADFEEFTKEKFKGKMARILHSHGYNRNNNLGGILRFFNQESGELLMMVRTKNRMQFPKILFGGYQNSTNNVLSTFFSAFKKALYDLGIERDPKLYWNSNWTDSNEGDFKVTWANIRLAYIEFYNLMAIAVFNPKMDGDEIHSSHLFLIQMLVPPKHESSSKSRFLKFLRNVKFQPFTEAERRKP